LSKANAKPGHSLIIGCGYLGKALAKELQAREALIFASARKKQTLHGLEKMGLRASLLNINEPDTWDISAHKKGGQVDVYFLVPPSQIEIASLQDFVVHLGALPLHRAILASSTVVYGNSEREVDADSEVDIDSPRAARQHRIEQLWQGLGEAARIVRFAGLYGPERIIGKKTLANGEKIPGLSRAWLNLIHIRDAARLLISIRESQRANSIELACDGRPVLRCEYYAALAKHLHCPAPVFSEDEHEKGRGRRCSNKITIERTGWQPQMLDYKDSF